MGLESISGILAASVSNYSADAKVKKEVSTSEKQPASSQEKTTSTENTGVVYEKNTDTNSQKDTTYDATAKKTKNSAIVEQMKADLASRTQQLQSIVSKMIEKQGATIGKADDIWSFLASGKYTVSEAAKVQAQKDIAEDGYWGVEQTSERIVSFAKALTDNDSSKADAMLDAFKKGYEEATKSWGKELPEISKKTYDAVIKKFDDWKNESKTSKDSIDESNSK